MTHREACEPCARRKVRCDKQEPCSNCRRRKKDRCIYPAVSPADRIKRLEALVRKLGADPNELHVPSNELRSEHTSSPASTPAGASVEQDRQHAVTFLEIRSKDPVVLEENGQPFYLESYVQNPYEAVVHAELCRRAWQGWLGINNNEGVSEATSSRNPFLLRDRPHALSSIIGGQAAVSLLAREPSPQYADALWNTYRLRVEPLVRISYRWALDQLRARSVDVEQRQHLSATEQAFVCSVYLISVHSLPDEECQSTFDVPKPMLLNHYHVLCEEALMRTNILCIADIMVIKAIILYTVY